MRWPPRRPSCTGRRCTTRRIGRARARSVEALAALEPELAITMHGPAMQGPEMRAALHRLAQDFDRVAVPEQGRYLGNPARAEDGSAYPQGVIRNYSDHAANERTFLAWVRTSLAVVGFGLALIKIEFLPHGMGVWLGFALVGIGCVILGLAAYRFISHSHEIERQETFRAGGVRSEVALAVLLMLFVLAFALLLWTASGS